MRSYMPWLLSVTVLLTSCATVPSAPAPSLAVQCPRVPALTGRLNLDAPERAYTDRMQLFLSGKLPAQPN